MGCTLFDPTLLVIGDLEKIVDSVDTVFRVRARSVNPLDKSTGRKSSVKNPVEFPALFALEAKTGKNTTSTGFLQKKKNSVRWDSNGWGNPEEFREIQCNRTGP